MLANITYGNENYNSIFQLVKIILNILFQTNHWINVWLPMLWPWVTEHSQSSMRKQSAEMYSIHKSMSYGERNICFHPSINCFILSWNQNILGFHVSYHRPDVLAPYFTSSSAVIETMQENWFLVFQKEEFQLPEQFQKWELIKNTKKYFPNWIQYHKG